MTARIYCSRNPDIRRHPASRGKKNHLYPDGALQRGEDTGNRRSRRCVFNPLVAAVQSFGNALVFTLFKIYVYAVKAAP